ncbi:hypothetical protein V6U90_13080 [Micromonospora sp. CPCC 206060]|uniref:hypothetical protein n=1 Tax=Micromonospora sp. CPCC 206060 TaxID=3122406 RepID=UPI002FEF5BB3
MNFAPTGSSPLDTVAVLTTLIPAGVIARCLHSRVESLEATRSRRRQPGRTLWLATVCLLAAASPIVITPMLQEQINRTAFVAAWTVVLGTYLLAGIVMPALAAFAATLIVVIVFSSPGVIPWEHNVLYNVQLSGLTTVIGVALLSSTVLAAALVRRTDPLTNHGVPS